MRDPVTVDEVGAFGDSLTAAGDVLTLPQDGFAHDAFYIARLTRKA